MRDRTYRGRPVAALPASPQRLINRLADKVVSAQELCSSSWAVRGETAALRAHPTQQCPPVDSPQQWPPPYGTCRARIRRVHDARCAGGERAAKDCHTWHAVREVHGVRATVKSELLMAAPRLQRCEVKWASVVTIVVEAVGHSYRTSKDNTDGESELLMQETWSTTTWLRMRSLWSRLVVFGGVADLPLSEHTGALLLHAMQTSVQRRPTYARRIMNTLQKVGERHHGLTLMDAALGASSALPPLQQATPLSGSDLLSVCAAAARVEGGASMGRGPARKDPRRTPRRYAPRYARERWRSSWWQQEEGGSRAWGPLCTPFFGCAARDLGWGGAVLHVPHTPPEASPPLPVIQRQQIHRATRYWGSHSTLQRRRRPYHTSLEDGVAALSTVVTAGWVSALVEPPLPAPLPPILPRRGRARLSAAEAESALLLAGAGAGGNALCHEFGGEMRYERQRLTRTQRAWSLDQR